MSALTATKKSDAPSTPLTDNKFESFARLVISAVALLFMGVLTLSSFLHTTGMEIVLDGQGVDNSVQHIKVSLESVVYYNDNIISNLIFLALSLMICFLVMPLLKKAPLWAEIAFIGVWTIVLGCIWVGSSQSAPSEDSWWVTDAGLRFARDEFHLLENERYFKNYSFQLGYVFFNEILIRAYKLFAEVKNLLFLEYVNVVLLAVTYIAIVLIMKRIFKDQRVRHMTVFLLAFAAQPIIFCSFLYGIIPGLAFAVWALYFEIVYLQSNKLQYAFFSVLCIGIAVMIKSNYLIFLIAIVAIAFVKLFKRKRFVQDICFIVMAVALSMSVSPLVKSMYESRSGVDLGDAVPYVSWISMGMNESENAPGWYSYGPTLTNFEVNQFNADEASKDSVKNIKDRLKYFSENPQYANDFFYKKFVSQWNETSYQSLWNNEVRYNYDIRGELAEWALSDGENKIKTYMDIFTQLIFAAVFVGLLACLKNRNFLTAALPLIIIGGMLYHLLSEAKSQYSIPYFILMTGFAAYGVVLIHDAVARKLDSMGRHSRFFTLPEPEPVPAAEIAAVPAAEATAENAVAETAPEADNAEEKAASDEETEAPENKNEDAE